MTTDVLRRCLVSDIGNSYENEEEEGSMRIMVSRPNAGMMEMITMAHTYCENICI